MEIEKLSDQLKRAFFEEAWHGPSVLGALDGITAEAATARPLAKAHSIWEIALHIAAWEGIVADRLEGKYEQPTDEEDWPKVSDTSQPAWEKFLESLKSGHERLAKVVEGINDQRLNEPIPDWGFTRYFLIQGVIQHDLYHAGQIALLKKAFTQTLL